jgi:hypothetical protein
MHPKVASQSSASEFSRHVALGLAGWDGMRFEAWAARQRGWLMLGLLAVGLIPRLALVASRTADLEPWEYETLAQNIAAGNGYVISRFGHLVLAFGDGNLYSFLAGALYAIFGHAPVLLAAVQAVLAALIAPAIFVVGERASGPRIAALGAVLAAFHPGLLAYSLKLHPLGLDAVLLALLVLWSTRGRWTRGGVILAGMTLGMNLMTRPTYFLTGLAAFGVRWLKRHASSRQMIAVIAISLAVAAPWIARNWLFLGRPLLISTSFEDVWKGNNPMSSGSSFLAPGEDIFAAAPIDLRNRIWHADELQANDVFAQETLSFIEHRPEQFASLFARKFAYFWWLPQPAGLLYPPSWLATYQVYASVMYTFAAIGIVGILRRGTAEERNLLTTLAAIGFSLAVIHALAYVEGRHRWGLEPLILLLTARGMFGVLGQVVGSQSRLLRRHSER